MPFVKLDCGMLDSSIWPDKPARDLFITALLMAHPAQFNSPQAQLNVNSLEETGWIAPPGWYGFVEAAGPGIVDRAKLPIQEGMEALKRLGSPDPDSRTAAHEGRRLIRINGGYLVLNFFIYRDRDYTNAIRQRRHRQKKVTVNQQVSQTVAPHSDPKRNGVTSLSVTHTEAEAEAYKIPPRGSRHSSVAEDIKRQTELKRIDEALKLMSDRVARDAFGTPQYSQKEKDKRTIMLNKKQQLLDALGYVV
jgi:hypothetical protein